MVKTMLPVQGAQGWSLVRKLRSHIPLVAFKKKKKFKKNKKEKKCLPIFFKLLSSFTNFDFHLENYLCEYYSE